MTNHWINAADIQLLKRSLWSNAKVVGGCICLIVAGGFQSSPPEARLPTMTHVSEVGMAAGQSGPIGDVPPHGWRRTSRGWEHTSTWPTLAETVDQRSISELVAIQQALQPQWLQSTLSKVCDIPPLLFAVLQIAAIAILMYVQRRYAK